MANPPKLKRSISLPLLVAYGVGTMVGGGFYALLGRMAHHAGMHLPLSILIAAVIALMTALSFGELASRLPYSAGESRYVDAAFGRRWLSQLIGWGVIATGVVSAATLSRAFVGFFQELWEIPTWLGIVLLVLLLTGIAIRGILESVWVAAVITVIEVAGLVWVLAANLHVLPDLSDRWTEVIPGFEWGDWSGVMIAAFLAFYAFIGFEDMVNEAEEVQQPRRNLWRGILYALLVTTTLYLLIGLVAVLAVPPAELGQSKTPLATLVVGQGLLAGLVMTVISMLAGVNGALVQIIMASRVCYGMSDQGMGPQQLAAIHPRFKTPLNATVLVGAIVLVLALWLPLEVLAKTTSGIMLFNFMFVNASLVRLKLQAEQPAEAVVRFPIVVPVLGCVLCGILLAIQLFAAPA